MALPVSVIVPVYNGLAQLPRCMDALLARVTVVLAIAFGVITIVIARMTN